MAYLAKQWNKYWAIHDVPPSLRGRVGRKRFSANLHTGDHAKAKILKAAYEAQWLMEIERARHPENVDDDAEFWRRAIRGAKDAEERALRVDLMIDAALDRAVTSDPEEAEKEEHVQRFVGIALGEIVKLSEHLDEYLGTLAGRNERKSVAMKKASIEKFCAEFPNVSDVTRKAVQTWVNRQAQESKAVATIRRSLSEMRGYWRYLLSLEAAPEGVDPFDKLTLPTEGKAASNDERKPFEAADVLRLLAEARKRKDATLADLIELGMWTGARIEELCALKIEKVGDGYIDIGDAKTDAGRRQVPVHSKLRPTLVRLMNNRPKGFVLPGLGLSKYGDRSNAIGKRFGRLKAELGFGPQYVFHSIRKTVATLLENAGVMEGVAADILGHEKQTMTYGLYSGGASLETKRKAIEKLRYPL